MGGNGHEPTGLIVLGATGTIGRLTLEIAARHPRRVRVDGLGGGKNAKLLARQAEQFQPGAVAVTDEATAELFRAAVVDRWRGEVLVGERGQSRLAARPASRIVINGIVGAAGLAPSLAALDAGKRLALANKESLVMAGGLIRAALERGGGELLPVDSEHFAIRQCLAGRDRAQVERIVLTASGGPFRDLSASAQAVVTPREALRHPTWKMGPRITIDSATLFNKGMELIEARWLFDLPLERIGVVIHPQSIVHGLIELRDGSLIAQLSQPDMRLPIQYAMSCPELWSPPVARCDLHTLDALTFAEPDETRFPCLALARQAGIRGGTAPTVVNAADEVLVEAFLAGRIPFPRIGAGLGAVLERHRVVESPSLADIRAADRWARQEAAAYVGAPKTSYCGEEG